MPPDLKSYLLVFLGTFLFLGAFIILLATLYTKKQQRNKNEKKEMQLQYHQTLLQSQLEIQEQTFKNISQEIHDNIGQALTLAKLNLNTMPSVTDQQKEKIFTTKEIISKTISDLRDLSRSLNTDYIADMGLQKAIEYEMNLISKSSSIKTETITEGKPFVIDKQKELILFRIVQEVLNNAIKHSEAKSIIAKMIYGSDSFELLITDNGKGFKIDDPKREKQPGSGLGLRNMDNRAKLIGASFSMNSGPGAGTEVRIILPFSHSV
ncbi:MAG: sensor histidine kinase [Chitinophagaceae bacterium]|nr:sensor histidine kinase [Chitinophagaceae bacterium]